MAAVMLLALMGCTALASAAMTPQHGFKVRAIHTLHKKDGEHVHTRHPVAMTSIRSRSDDEVFEVFKNEREMIRALWQLNMQAYRSIPMYNEASMSEIINSRHSVFGQDITTYEEEKQATEKMINTSSKFLDNLSAGAELSDLGGPLGPFDFSSIRPDMGVYATEWSLDGFGVVLCFRGAESNGEHANTMLYITEFVNSGLTPWMHDQWKAMELESDVDIRAIKDEKAQEAWAKKGPVYFEWLKAGMANYIDHLDEDSAKLVNKNAVNETGYWEFTKAIVDSVYYEANASGRELYLTGHSAGGGQAQLASMYLKRKHSKPVRAITFAATGVACSVRKLSVTRSELMLEDVDPNEKHEQVTDYTHALDIFGHLGHKVGTQCIWGVENIKYSRAAEYCKAAFQRTGPTLMTEGLDPANDLKKKFDQCRYFTHSRAGTDTALMDDRHAVLYANGTTDGGCIEAVYLSEEQGDEMCAAQLAPLAALTQQSRGELTAAAVIARHV